MATTSLTWTSDSCRRLLSCGIDSERVARFRRMARDRSRFMPFVFTSRERSRCRRLPDPAAGLCAAFCVKEALYKALGSPYNFTDCEFLPGRDSTKGFFAVSPRFAADYPGVMPCVKILAPVKGHCTAIVYLLDAA
jgi:phosphopantetheinyl transferase (holo-ACP synthase)